MIGAETFTECLYRHVEPWTAAQDLGERVGAALAEGLPSSVFEAAVARCDHRGEAAARTAEAFAELLDDLRAVVPARSAPQAGE